MASRTDDNDDRRVALVTGGNRGLGLETCRQLGERGFRVILTARRPEPGRKAADALADDGLDVDHRTLDVTSAESIEALSRSLAADRVRLDVLVNNAAIALDGFDAAVARDTLAGNFYGPLHVTDGLSGTLVDGGTIVMVSSGSGELSGFVEALRRRFLDEDLTRSDLIALMESFVIAVADSSYREKGWPGSAYAVSKAGLNALTRILARELGPRRIKVNAVCPGWVRTDMGGPVASRDVAEGAASIVWAALLADDGPSGGFYRDGRSIPW